MPVWASTTPTRTGVPSILNCVDCILSLMAAYKSIMKEHADVSVHTYIDGLQNAAEAFKDNVPHPREGFDL